MVVKIYRLIFVLLAVIYANELNARLYFIHVPKTGGTTLRLLLEQQLATNEIYPFRHQKHANAAIEQSLVSGHFSYSFCKNRDPEFERAFKITILRDPVERYLSFLRAKKKADPSLTSLESVFELRRAPHGKYSMGLIDNALCRQLAKNPHLTGEALLTSAKEALLEFDEIIFYDHYSEEVSLLFERLGIDLPQEEIPWLNATTPEPVSQKLLEEVKSLNELDRELYTYAKAHYVKRENKYELRTQSYKELLSPKNEIHYTFDQPLNGHGWTYRDLFDLSRIERPIFRWVTDSPAVIYFFLEEGLDYDVYFTARPIVSEISPQMSVNGVEIPLSQLSQAPFSLYHGVISKDLIQKLPTELMFFGTKACEYRKVNPLPFNRNHPPLSFALNEIKIQSRK